jgi:hypothetical protein
MDFCARNGVLPFQEVLMFCSGGDGVITKWWDQFPNANHLMQGTSANQPRIVSAGVLDVDVNGKPTIVFDGSNDCLINSANHASIDFTSYGFMISMVYNPTKAAGSNHMLLAKNNTSADMQYGILHDTTNKQSDQYVEVSIRNNSGNNSIPQGTQVIHSAVWNSGSQKNYINGAFYTNATTGTYSGTITSKQNLIIGARSETADGSNITTSQSFRYQGSISEVILSDNSWLRQQLEKNQGHFYNKRVT